MKLTRRISSKLFITSHILILILGLIFIFALYYILNIQYQKENKPFLQGPVTSIPKSLRLDLDQPADNTLTFQNSVVISGQTLAAKDVLVFSDSKDLIIKSKQDGSFSTVLNLQEGVNFITVAVFDTNGESKSEQRTVYFSKEKI